MMQTKTWFITAGAMVILCGLNTAVADRLAVVDGDGLVVNVITVPDNWTGAAGEWQLPSGHSSVSAGGSAPGDTWDGAAFVKPVVVLTSVPISYAEFESRFTTDEQNAMVDFVYAVDTDTGVPNNRNLIRSLSRAIAKNYVDLLHPKTEEFMAQLVIGEVVTQARSDQILDPDWVRP
jgi:hypothetical protein